MNQEAEAVEEVVDSVIVVIVDKAAVEEVVEPVARDKVAEVQEEKATIKLSGCLLLN